MFKPTHKAPSIGGHLCQSGNKWDSLANVSRVLTLASKPGKQEERPCCLSWSMRDMPCQKRWLGIFIIMLAPIYLTSGLPHLLIWIPGIHVFSQYQGLIVNMIAIHACTWFRDHIEVVPRAEFSKLNKCTICFKFTAVFFNILVFIFIICS